MAPATPGAAGAAAATACRRAEADWPRAHVQPDPRGVPGNMYDLIHGRSPRSKALARPLEAPGVGLARSALERPLNGPGEAAGGPW
eukprot:3717285-Lingulodinium_polyedra.AAC.1